MCVDNVAALPKAINHNYAVYWAKWQINYHGVAWRWTVSLPTGTHSALSRASTLCRVIVDSSAHCRTQRPSLMDQILERKLYRNKNNSMVRRPESRPHTGTSISCDLDILKNFYIHLLFTITVAEKKQRTQNTMVFSNTSVTRIFSFVITKYRHCRNTANIRHSLTDLR